MLHMANEVALREQAINKLHWKSVLDGVPLGSGVPLAELLDTARVSSRLKRTASNVVLVTLADGSMATGYIIELRRGPTSSRSSTLGTLSGSALAERPAHLTCVLTCKHVLPTKRDAKGAHVAYDYIKTKHLQDLKHVALRPDVLFAKSCGDVALCAVDPHTTRPTTTLSLARSDQVRHGDKISILQHPNAVPVVLEKGTVVSAGDRCFLHNVNTLVGSSGSPVIKGHLLVGVHARSRDVDVNDSTLTLNEGCYLDSMLDTLGEHGFMAVSASAVRRRQKASSSKSHSRKS